MCSTTWSGRTRPGSGVRVDVLVGRSRPEQIEHRGGQILVPFEGLGEHVSEPAAARIELVEDAVEMRHRPGNRGGRRVQ
jgi:hypothetical protein